MESKDLLQPIVNPTNKRIPHDGVNGLGAKITAVLKSQPNSMTQRAPTSTTRAIQLGDQLQTTQQKLQVHESVLVVVVTSHPVLLLPPPYNRFLFPSPRCPPKTTLPKPPAAAAGKKTDAAGKTATAVTVGGTNLTVTVTTKTSGKVVSKIVDVPEGALLDSLNALAAKTDHGRISFKDLADLLKIPYEEMLEGLRARVASTQNKVSQLEVDLENQKKGHEDQRKRDHATYEADKLQLNGELNSVKNSHDEGRVLD
ncbi:MAG: hypothetical protein SGARI_004478 [Bacillariaceae sp.]